MRFVVFTPENARDSLAPGNLGKYHHKRQIVQIFENVVIGDNFGFGSMQSVHHYLAHMIKQPIPKLRIQTFNIFLLIRITTSFTSLLGFFSSKTIYLIRSHILENSEFVISKLIFGAIKVHNQFIIRYKLLKQKNPEYQ